MTFLGKLFNGVFHVLPTKRSKNNEKVDHHGFVTEFIHSLLDARRSRARGDPPGSISLLGEVISTTETSEGNYEVVAQIQFELETRRGEVLHGGGLALTGTATASPSGAFNCRGRGEVTAVPVEIEGRPDETTDLWQIELEATQFRVFLEEGSADDLSSLTILGLSGTASASPSGA